MSRRANMTNPGEAAKSFVCKFTVLKGGVRELWIVFAVKLIGIAAYGVMNSTLVLWLSADLGYDDIRAGAIVTTWSTVMTLFTVLVGSLTDAIGLRKAFLLGITCSLIARAVMTFCMGKGALMFFGLLPLAIGEALLGPVMVAAIRRYTTTAQRSISYSLFYALMNGGFAIANFLFDSVRKHLGEYGRLDIPFLATSLSTYRTLFLASLLLTIPNVLILFFLLRDGVEVTDEAGIKIAPEPAKYPGKRMVTALGLTISDALRDTVRIFAGLWRQPGFYKFLVFLSLAAFVRLIFFHMYYTYPKFGIRELGQGAPIGKLWAINSLLILFLVPIIGALSQRIAAYRMV
ncbi:MFS transporter, partial [bacterium]|nr:MFS transporter [bacterium]